MSSVRTSLLVTALAAALALAACSAGVSDVAGSSSGSEEERQTVTEPTLTDDSETETVEDEAEGGEASSEEAEWPTNAAGQTFPEPRFSSTPYRVSTFYDTSASIYYDGVTRDEVDAYVQTLKDAGYAYDVSETEGDGTYEWSADDDADGDGYFDGSVSLSYRAESGDRENVVVLQLGLMP